MTDSEYGTKVRDGKTYGCHADLGPGEYPDGCVIDYGAPGDCSYGIHKNNNVRTTVWTCPHWKPFDPDLPPPIPD